MITLADLQQHGLEKLDVYVDDRQVAVLAKEGKRYVLAYLPTANPQTDFVSLSMPVRTESWVSEGALHPFFEINLPEGIRRDAIASRFGKAMVAEEMSLLAIVGNDSIGRVSVVPSGYPLNWKNKCLVNIEDMDMDPLGFFSRAFNEYAAQGISGVQPKVLTSERITLKSDGWILKREGEGLEGIAINEYLSMRAAGACGLEVPECQLSTDGKVLLVKRFDHAGFEDLCALMGLSPTEKYSGTMERMLKVVSLLVTQRQEAKEAILRSIVFNTCIGNSDAHLKNFGLVYDNKEVKMAPFFDLVSVRAFQDFRNDIPSISINGKKEWVIGKAFHSFATNLGVSPASVTRIVNEVKEGIQKSIPLIAKMADERPEFRELGKSMIGSWTTGLRRISGEKVSQDSFEVLVQYGMSGKKSLPSKKDNPCRVTQEGSFPKF